MNGSRVFWLVMYGFMTLTVVFTFFRFGPIVERIAMPVVTVHAEFQLLRQDGFTFILVGEKHRNCQLELFTAAWRFDSTSEVAPLYDATTGEIFTAPRTIEPGEDFTFGPLFVKFTPSSYSLTNVELRGIMYYSCHNLWMTSYSYRIKVIVPSAPAELRQAPLQ